MNKLTLLALLAVSILGSAQARNFEKIETRSPRNAFFQDVVAGNTVIEGMSPMAQRYVESEGLDQEGVEEKADEIINAFEAMKSRKAASASKKNEKNVAEEESDDEESDDEETVAPQESEEEPVKVEKKADISETQSFAV